MKNKKSTKSQIPKMVWSTTKIYEIQNPYNGLDKD